MQTTIFKKSIRTWLALTLSLLILTFGVHYLAKISYKSDAEQIESDPQYAKIYSKIRAQNLDAEKIRKMAEAEEPSSKKLVEDILGFIFLFVSYGLIFRCVARVVLGEWKSPWIS